ncbi:antibiotic biosynthesis monooxygenase family protein [Spongiivirga sp. MCCC 1A20706]|uniref:putative quinol monooxygenase n=1 Tax=Spongiivirga sp. MCCC 1A20706 TaxID=3160963 RepID=UPI003977B131
MLVRIVKMSFNPQHIEDFISIFEDSKSKIRGFHGCDHLELYQDKNTPNLFFTYSHWQSEAHLNAYRHSDYFEKVWKATKALFNDKPEAWSVDTLYVVNDPKTE